MMSMAFQSSTIKPSSAVPCLCSVLLLLVLTMCSLPSCSHAKSRCKCPGSDSRGARNTMSSTFTTTFDEIFGDLYSTNSSGIIQYLPGDLGYYMKGHYSELSLSDTGLFIMDDQRIQLWVYDDGVAYDPSFSIVFNMSLYQPNDSDSDDAGTLIFAIIPIAAYQNGSTSLSLIDLSSCTNIVDQWGVLIGISNTSITIQAGILDWEFKSANDTIICVKIRILPIQHGVPVSPSSDYRITIVYPLDSNMSIQVELDPPQAQPSSYGSSVNTSMHINISHTISSPFAMFSFCSSMGQLLQLHTFTSTVGLPPWEHPQEKKGASTSTIVWSVLGSAAATAVKAAAVAYWYFNSKYRGWKKDLDQLAKSMQQLPGVPTQFDFADIKKATNNFHETIRLGQGGFGSLQVQASCAGGRREEVQPGQQSTLRGLPNRGQCHQPLATQEYRPSRRVVLP